MTMDEEQKQAKLDAEESFKRTLALFEAGHELDKWSRTCLLQALLAMKAGLYGVARMNVEHCTEQPSIYAAKWVDMNTNGLDMAGF